jgi:hypothetical protein
MNQTIEAVIDEQGRVRLLEAIQLLGPRRALVTVLEEAPLLSVEENSALETALLSEAALVQDWNRPEEDAVWAYLQLCE